MLAGQVQVAGRVPWGAPDAAHIRAAMTASTMNPDNTPTGPDGRPMRVASGTYRLQMNGDFDFAAAAAVAPYLARLGVSHAYCSPYLQSESGSRHGYDVSDHTRVNVELGGPDGHATFCRALREAGLGQILDIVPNHMSISSPDNAWWWDVLKLGEASAYAGHFDVDWDSVETWLKDRILVPILGDHYGRVLDAGDLRLERRDGELVVAYHEHRLPIDPATLEGSPTEGAIAALNRDRERLHDLLERQHYRLASWRTASQELVHRRFFDVNNLAGLRMEDERVFLDTHALVLRWLDSGVLDGVRVDHPDGLRDPEEYFRRLREAAPWAWIVIEKILARGEQLVPAWPVDGTTGYEFLNRLLGLYIAPSGEAPLTRLYEDLMGEPGDFAEVAHEAKLYAILELLASDLERLTRRLNEICEGNRRLRDHTPADQRAALAEMMACLPVYRTYLCPGRQPSQGDVASVSVAAREATARRPDLDPELFELISTLLIGGKAGEPSGEFAARFQQTTGAVTAKGVEDTAFYRFNRLVCLNEVGGDPGRWGTTLGEFHRASVAVAERWPRTMLATSTHDTKRSEDMRARLALLSEVPDDWGAAVRRWFEMNARHRLPGGPDAGAEYLLYQTLVGAYPLSEQRCAEYLEKAGREAKRQTSWLRPNAEYEDAVRRFIAALYADPDFQADLSAFVMPLVGPGRVNSLSSKLVALTAPGVPDIYQGTELWDLSLVDPDNRRIVDFELRGNLLEELDLLSPEEVCARADEGLPKLLTVSRTLRLRRRRPDLFGPGAGYRPLLASGPRAGHLVAFARQEGAVTLAPRLVMGLGGDWQETEVELPSGAWRDELTGLETPGGSRRVGDLLSNFPVSLLVRR